MNDPMDLLASGHRFIASTSGGKDSGAMCLSLKERDIPFEPVFMDTGWELPETYDYLRDVLPRYIGPIRWLRAEVTLPPDREVYALELDGMLGHYSAMIRWCLKKGMLPAGRSRWCTGALKVDVMNAWADTLDSDVVHCVGIRGEESDDRATMTEWEWDAKRGAWVWRPVHGCTLDDVIAIHKRHGLAPNPLYLLRAHRIGCGPCIFSLKDEIRWFAERYPERIRILRRLEEIMILLYEKMRQSAPERRGLQYLPPTWFQHNSERTPEMKDTGYAWPIDKVVEWSQTSRGGKQVELFAAPPRDTGCMRWGMCDTGSGEKP